MRYLIFILCLLIFNCSTSNIENRKLKKDAKALLRGDAIAYRYDKTDDPFIAKNYDFNKAHKYELIFQDTINPLNEKNILFELDQYLESINWIKTNKQPELFIMLSYSHKNEEIITKERAKIAEIDNNKTEDSKLDFSGDIDYSSYKPNNNSSIYSYQDKKKEFTSGTYSFQFYNKSKELISSIEISLPVMNKYKNIFDFSKIVTKMILDNHFLEDSNGFGFIYFKKGCKDINASNYCKECAYENSTLCKN